MPSTLTRYSHTLGEVLQEVERARVAARVWVAARVLDARHGRRGRAVHLGAVLVTVLVAVGQELRHGLGSLGERLAPSLFFLARALTAQAWGAQRHRCLPAVDAPAVELVERVQVDPQSLLHPLDEEWGHRAGRRLCVTQLQLVREVKDDRETHLVHEKTDPGHRACLASL